MTAPSYQPSALPPRQATPARAARLRPGLRLTIHGRTLMLRRLRQPPAGPIALLVLLGPGLIAAIAGDDAGGIATYSSIGARFGYDLLWLLALVTISLANLQETCARLGAATGRGLLDLIRVRFGIEWTLLASLVTLLANGGVLVTEFAGIGAAAELLGVSRAIAIPLAAAAIAWLVVAGSYVRVEKVFLAMALVFIAYPAAAILARPDWGEVARATLVPTIRLEREFLFLAVGMLGTTITPYMQLFQQSSVVEKGVARRHYGMERWDAYSGALFSNLIAGFVIVAAAATLHRGGVHEINDAAQAAQALSPAAGEIATLVFAVGLVGASLLASGVLPLATAYAASEAFGFRKGVNLDPRRAPTFFGIFASLIVVSSAVALLPGVPLIGLLVGVQVLNGILAPILLTFVMLLSDDRALMGELRNSPLQRLLGWASVGLVSLAVALYLATQLSQAVGLGFAGG